MSEFIKEQNGEYIFSDFKLYRQQGKYFFALGGHDARFKYEEYFELSEADYHRARQGQVDCDYLWRKFAVPIRKKARLEQERLRRETPDKTLRRYEDKGIFEFQEWEVFPEGEDIVVRFFDFVMPEHIVIEQADYEAAQREELNMHYMWGKYGVPARRARKEELEKAASEKPTQTPD